jgi:hypothetical protein
MSSRFDITGHSLFKRLEKVMRYERAKQGNVLKENRSKSTPSPVSF